MAPIRKLSELEYRPLAAQKRWKPLSCRLGLHRWHHESRIYHESRLKGLRRYSAYHCDRCGEERLSP